MRPRRAPLFALSLVACLLLSVGATRAQEAPPAAEAKPAKPEAPAITAIRLPDVTAAANDAAAQLTKLEKELAEQASSTEIQDSLADLNRRVAVLDEETHRLLQADLSVDGLRAIENRWKALAAEPAEWSSVLTARAESHGERIEELDALRERWVLTSKLAVESQAPASVQKQISATLSGIKKSRKLTETRLAAVLTLQSTVADHETRIDGSLSSVRKEIDEQLTNIFVRDLPPLWSPEFPKTLEADLEQGLGPAVKNRVQEIRAFVDRRAQTLSMLGAIFIALVVVLQAVKRRARQRAEEMNELAEAARIYELPISTALLITLLLRLWILPDPPPVVTDLLGIAVLIPAIVVLRHLMDSHLHPILYAVLGFFLLHQLRDLAQDLPGLSRLLFLVQMLAGILLTLWLLRPARLRKVPAEALSRTTFRYLGFATRIPLVVFSIAFVAEVLGFIQLGRLVGGSVLYALYVAIIFYALVRVGESLVAFALRGRPLRLLHLVVHHRAKLEEATATLLRWVALVSWLVFVLDFLNVFDPIWAGVRSAFTAKLVLGALSLSLVDVLAFGLMIWASVWLSRTIRLVLDEDVYPRVTLQRGLPYAISTMLHYTILAVGFLFAVLASGIQLDRIALMVGALGVGIGFGLQNVVNNFVSGILILFERPIQVGDQVQLDQLGGEVKRIGMRASVVRTWDGAEVVVPNGDFISLPLTNWTLSDRNRRIELPVGVAYGTDPKRVLEILVAVAEAHPEVFGDPAPYALFGGFGDSSLDFELRAWCRADVRLGTRSDLCVAINDALAAADITIPFPQRDLHVRSVESDLQHALVHRGDAPASDGS